MRTILNYTVTIIFFLFQINVCVYSEEQLTQKENQILNAYRIILETESFNNIIMFKSLGVVKTSEGNTVEKYFRIRQNENYVAPFNGENFLNVGIGINNYGRETIDLNWGSEGYSLDINWLNDRIESIGNYQFIYNNEGKIVTVSYRWESWGKFYIRNTFHIFYDTNNNVTKIEKIVIAGKGKSEESVKVGFSFLQAIKTYSGINDSESYSYNLQTNNMKQKENEPSTIVSNKKVSVLFNKKEMSCKVDDIITNKTIISFNFIFYENGSIKTYSKNDFEFSDFKLCEYFINDKAWRNKIIEKSWLDFNRENFKSHSEEYLEYSLKEGGDVKSMRTYRVITSGKDFKKTGIVFREWDSEKARELDESGNWGPWKRYTY